MELRELVHKAKNKVVHLREIIISTVQQQPLRVQRIKSVDRLDISCLRKAKRRLASVLMIVGGVTVLCCLVGIFISPGVERKGAEVQRLQRDFHAGKIDWKQFDKAYQEALKK